MPSNRPKELVLGKQRVRQAGTIDPDGKLHKELKTLCEGSLYAFGRTVCGFERFSPTLHLPTCRWLQKVPRGKRRKLLLMPRDHLKTSMMRALVAHVLIQEPENNVYFPGRSGANTRILYAGETATNAEHQLRWISAQFTSNGWLRTLWPERVWANARRDSPKWNEKEILIPRSIDFPEASVETIGVGGAVVGRHYDVFIKDDLISLEAANSEVVMRSAIEWHKTSRALMDHPEESLEWMIGTRWAAYDLYQEIVDNDPSVELLIRAAIENGQPIMPEIFSLETLDQLRRELGPLYYLLYMNAATDPALADFDPEDLRESDLVGHIIRFDEGYQDDALSEAMNMPRTPAPESVRGLRLNSENHSRLFGWQKFREKVRDN